LIKIENFTFRYGDAEKPALKDINLQIRDGEFVLITGPSGGGKSSLCRCFNGLIPHFYGGRVTGKVEVQGTDVISHSTKELATKVGMIFQDPENQLVATDVEREIAFGMENLSFPKTLIAKRLEESLDTLGISALRYKQVHELSGGEKQKVAIASVLALHPGILVLDEPTSELDPKSAEEVLSIVERLNDELGLTIILIEHRLDRVAQHADRIIMMSHGGIAADGDPRQVLSSKKPQETGVGLPPITKLVQGMREKGINIDKMPLTVREGRTILEGAFRKVSSQVTRDDKDYTGEQVIEIKKLWYVYPTGVTALKDVSLKVYQGEFVAVMGRNASGKTTLVKNINGLLKPARGIVTVEGTDTRKATIAELAGKVGFVFQNPNDHLFADTVEEEIAFTLKNLGSNGVEVKPKVEEMLERFDIKEYRKQYPRYLSGGEKQRVALASVIVTQPGILILDEPTRGMDYGLKSRLMVFLNEYRHMGNTVIMVTHDVEMVAEHADRVILMSEGKIVVDGNKREVLSKALLFSPQINRLVQAFGEYGVPEDVLTVDEALDLLP
jgi:energy-coupling factor transporter ATP-binding protein EcfA2